MQDWDNLIPFRDTERSSCEQGAEPGLYRAVANELNELQVDQQAPKGSGGHSHTQALSKHVGIFLFFIYFYI